MKLFSKFLFITTFLFLSITNGFAQCNTVFTTALPTTAQNAGTSFTSQAGRYAILSVTAGKAYEIESNLTTQNFCVREGSYNGSIVAQGGMNGTGIGLVYVAQITGLAYIHIYTQACATSTTNRTITVTDITSTYNATNNLTYTQGFNSTVIPVGNWYAYAVNMGSTAARITGAASGSNPTTTPQEGANFIRFNSYTCSSGATARLVSPSISTIGTSSVDVEFFWAHDNGFNTSNDNVQLQYSIDGNTWTNVGSPISRYLATAGATATWTKYITTLPLNAGNRSKLYVGFLFTSTFGNNCSLDNVKVVQTPPCPGLPTSLTSSNITSTLATLSWTAPSPAPGSGYDIYYSTSSTTPISPTNPTVTSSTTSVNISNLTSNTTYYWWVRSNCNGTDKSNWVSGGTFKTLLASELCSEATTLTVYPFGSCTSTSGTTTGASQEVLNPSCDATGTIRDVWYKFNTGVNTSLNFTITLGTASNVGIEFYTACGQVATTLSTNCNYVATNVTSVSGFSPNTNYYFRIFTNATYDIAGTFGLCVFQNPIPSCATIVSPANGSTNQNLTSILQWNSVTYAQGYDIYLSDNSTLVNNQDASVKVSSNQSTTSYTATGLSPLTTYYWKVVPKNTTGDASSCSVWSFTTAQPQYATSWISSNTESSWWCQGETRNVTVTVKNNGSVPWIDNGTDDYNIGVKWDSDVDYLVRVDVQNLASGATGTFTLPLTAPTSGLNNLTFDVVKEGQFWFASNTNGAGPGNIAHSKVANVNNTYPNVNGGTDITTCQGSQVTLNGTSPNVDPSFTGSNTSSATIPDYQGSTVGNLDRTITVNGTGANANQLTSVSLNITHTYGADLDIFLIAPNGSSIVLSTDNGGSGDNYTNTIFSTTGASIISGTSPFTGTFTPEQPFSSLTGPADGIWTLKMQDDANGDVGTFNSWGITFTLSTIPPTVSWSGSNSFTSNTLSTTIPSAIANTNTYTLSSTYRSCTSTSTVQVTGRPTITASISGSVNVCPGESTNITFTNPMALPITITYNLNGGTNQTINVGANSTNTVSFSSLSVGNHTYNLVSAIYQSSPNCSVNLSGSVVIMVRPTPTATISGTMSVCLNGSQPSVVVNNPLSLPITVTYNINGGSNQTINVNGNASGSIPVPTNVLGDFTYNLVSAAYQTSPTCSSNITGSVIVSVVQTQILSQPLSTMSVCEGEPIELICLATGISLSYQWYKDGLAIDPSTNPSTESPSLLIDNSSLSDGGQYYVKITSICGTIVNSNVSTLTIKDTPSAYASTNNSVLCQGSTVNFVGTTDIGTSFNWTGPNFYSTQQSPTLTNVTFTDEGTYTFTATLNGCSYSSSVDIEVNPTPSAITITPSSVTRCANSSANLLTATGGSATFTRKLGVNTTITSNSGVTPFTVTSEGARIQYLITNTELSALGLSPGASITSVAFKVMSQGNYPQSNFTIKMAQVLNTNLTNGYATSIVNSVQTVYSSGQEPAPSPGWKVFQFTNSFLWTGYYNIIIEVCYENDNMSNFCNNCYGGQSSAIEFSQTSFNSVYGTYDNNTDMCSNTGNNVVSSKWRPNMKLGIYSPTIVTWSPFTGLFTDAAATQPYNGGVTNSVYTKTTSSMVYTASAGGCVASAQVPVTVTPLPGIPGSITGPTTVCSPSSVTYFISSMYDATSYSWVVPSGVTIQSGQGTTSITVSIASTFTSGSISVSSINSCGTGQPSVLSVTSTGVNPPATPSRITGTTNVCSNYPTTPNADGYSNNVLYSSASVAGASTYNWRVPSGVRIYSGQGTRNVLLQFGPNFTSGNVEVRAGNSCGVFSSYVALAVTKTPPVPGVISGPTCVTNGTPLNYSIASVTGATSYDWMLPMGGSGSSSTTSITITLSGFTTGYIQVRAVTGCGVSSWRTLYLTKSPDVPGQISGPFLICPPLTTTYSIASVQGASSYNWILPTGVSGSSTTTSISASYPSNFTSGSVQVRSVSGSCASAYSILSISNCMSGRLTSVNQISTSDIKVYPIPTSDKIVIEYESINVSSVSIQIFDYNGKLVVLENRLLSPGLNKLTESLEGFSSGPYMLRFIDGDRTFNRRFIKQ